MKIKIYIFLIVTMFFCLYFLSCEDPSEPTNQIEPGRRDYIWEEDTLDVPLHEYVIFRDMVGNSPDDIWLGNLDPGLWYYNGVNWEIAEFPGVIPSALWLFEDNRMWVGTKEKLLLKRDNGTWTDKYFLTHEDKDIINIYGMYGKEKNDILAVGIERKIIVPGKEDISKGIILHYDGSEWKFMDFPELYETGLHYISYQENIDTYFIWGMKIENGVILDKLFTYDGKNLSEILSTSGSISLSMLNGIVYINNNFEVYKYSNKKLVLWKDFSGTEFRSNFVGRSQNDFFNNSIKGIGHYNGIDYKTIYPTHLELYTRIVFEREIFVTALDSDNKHYIIIHGTLID